MANSQQSLEVSGISQRRQRNVLLRRYPVSFPLGLLACALLAALGTVSVSGPFDGSVEALFPLFVLLGLPSFWFTLFLAFVLGTCGILIAIINILEALDGDAGLPPPPAVQAVSCPHTKEPL